MERKRRDQSLPQSRLIGKSVRLLGVAFYLLRLKAFSPRLALRRSREAPFKTLAMTTPVPLEHTGLGMWQLHFGYSLMLKYEEHNDICFFIALGF